jgi:hypothetical protein
VPVTQPLADMAPFGSLADGAGDRPKAKWGCSRVHRKTGLFLWDHSQWATWVLAYLLKTPFLGLGLCLGFVASSLDTKAPTRALVSVDGCQMLFSVGRFSWGPPPC